MTGVKCMGTQLRDKAIVYSQPVGCSEPLKQGRGLATRKSAGVGRDFPGSRAWLPGRSSQSQGS